MSAYTYLMNHESDAPTTAVLSPESCLLAANFQIPILWIALFDIADLTFIDLADKVPTLIAPTIKARKTYGARRLALAAALGEENAGVIAEWEDFVLSGFGARTLQLDLDELWAMYPDEFEQELREWLAAIDSHAGPGWDLLCSQACFDDPEVRRFGLRGFAWEASLDWE